MVCNNCGKQGHTFFQCRQPITSYGVIVFRNDPHFPGQRQYLMIRRKDSFGYIDFVRGKYNPNHLFQLQTIIDQMSLSEKQRIVELPFEALWRDMWGEGGGGGGYRQEEHSSLRKYQTIWNGVFSEETQSTVTLRQLVEESATRWPETEWEFPKGRRQVKEKEVDCALREFQEETGIPVSELQLLENVLPYEETFIGTNYKAYKHKYFIAQHRGTFAPFTESTDLSHFQTSEVSCLEWKSLANCLQSIRPYHVEKREVLQKVDAMLHQCNTYAL